MFFFPIYAMRSLSLSLRVNEHFGVTGGSRRRGPRPKCVCGFTSRVSWPSLPLVCTLARRCECGTRAAESLARPMIKSEGIGTMSPSLSPSLPWKQCCLYPSRRKQKNRVFTRERRSPIIRLTFFPFSKRTLIIPVMSFVIVIPLIKYM